ncbi:MAG: hypothetical protein GXP63_07105 [DPANN group archaeon]|nr:hypothetical protein [DPANN group archaeon]
MTVLDALRLKAVPFEFNEVSRRLDHPSRAEITYDGRLFPELIGKTFGELFAGDVAVPKLLIQKGDGPVEKILRSDEMVARIQDMG